MKGFYEHIVDCKKKITDYLDSRQIDYDNTVSLEDLAKLADDYWKTDPINTEKIRARANTKWTEEHRKEFMDYYKKHSRKETAEHFNLKESSVAYMIRYIKQKHRRMYNKAYQEARRKTERENRAAMMKGNSIGIFNRDKKHKEHKEETFVPKFIKFR